MGRFNTRERDLVQSVRHSRRDFGQVTGFAVDFEMGPDAAVYVAVMRIPPEPSKVVNITQPS